MDESSQVEVSFSVISMFEWYTKADYCLAYLHDVRVDDVGRSVESSDSSDESDLFDDFRDSRGCKSGKFADSVWFRRGWTLQELLAPKTVVFINHRFKVLGHKCTTSCFQQHGSQVRSTKLPRTIINETLSNITGILLRNIRGIPASGHDFSIEQVMEWMEDRKTTEAEDMIYSISGLFNIHMSPQYGEGYDDGLRRLKRELRCRQMRL